MPSILLIWDRLGDYHRTRAAALRRAYTDGTVYTADLGAGDDLYRWEDTDGVYTHIVLSEKPVQEFDFFNRISYFLKINKERNIGILGIAGYGHIEYLTMIVLGRLTGKRVILFAESWYPGNKVGDWLKRTFLRLFVDGFFVSGSRAERHFHQRLGVPMDKIRKGYSVVDNDHFARRSASTSKDHLGSTPHTGRNDEGSKDAPIFNPSTRQPVNSSTAQPIHPSTLTPYLLTVARYSPEKNLPFLIEAYRNSDLYRKWKLVLIGDGPQKEILMELAGKDADHILLAGWKSYSELPQWYHHASAFVLPSLFEPWGLVVNEALAAGVPVVVSENCGCVPDLVQGHGLVFNLQDIQELRNLLNNVYHDQLPVRKASDTSFAQVMDRFNPDSWSEAFLHLISTDA